MYILTGTSKCLFTYIYRMLLSIVHIKHMNKIIDISHSFRTRNQYYRLATVRFAFQILNAKDQPNQVETSLQSPKI